jgi:multidrug efflux pump subunit AcrA (membrane-fusion protein)
LVCAAEPKPAYWRMVHSRERYMAGWMPRVYGGSPAGGVRRARSRGRSAAEYATATGRSDGVVRGGASGAVVVVEAMKMQNELTVTHDGIVSEVLVGERAAVAAGQALVRLAPAPAGGEA